MRLLQFSALVNLDLSANKLGLLPLEFSSAFPKLRKVSLARNGLTVIPTPLLALSALTAVDLSGNALVSLPGLSVAWPHLAEFDVSQNRIVTLPPDIVSLTELQILRANTNKLQVLPDGLSRLTKLSILDVANNDLTQLPTELGLLEESLKGLNVEGNMLKTIRQTIISQGTIALLRYLKSRLPVP